tara:strand:- start:519 stop:1115 length:597 start_codon:yes stop_codon:yes gene_type:complete
MPYTACTDNKLQPNCSVTAQAPSYASSKKYVEILPETKKQLGCLSSETKEKCTLGGVTQYDGANVSAEGQFGRMLGSERLDQAKGTAQIFPNEIRAYVPSSETGAPVTITRYLMEKLGQAAVPKAALDYDVFSRPTHTVTPTPRNDTGVYTSPELFTLPERDPMGVSASESALAASQYLTENVTFQPNNGAVVKVTSD